jgi:hypothetical protein
MFFLINPGKKGPDPNAAYERIFNENYFASFAFYPALGNSMQLGARHVLEFFSHRVRPEQRGARETGFAHVFGKSGLRQHPAGIHPQQRTL